LAIRYHGPSIVGRDQTTVLAARPRLAGRYAHVRELGRGSSGRVVLARDEVGGGPRAIKIVSRADGERLRWEWALLASLAHPGLARVHELVTVDAPLGAPFRLEPGAVALVEDFVEGASAAERVAALAEDADRVRFAVSVGMAVARALGAMHAAGLVHGDVKPANVVVPEDPAAAVLIDLGLARPMGVSPTVGGTPAFLAPEAWLGERTVATDLYALGATLHALLCGRTAFDTAGSSASLASALARRPRLDELPAAAPVPLRRLAGDLLAEEPARRPAGAREVALRLAAIAPDVGAPVGEADALSDAPTGVERAARAARCPLTGRARERAALIEALGEPGLVAVVGPPGAGRSRLVREAVRGLQQAAAVRGETVPTYVASDGALPRIEHDAIVHLEAGAPALETCRAALEAAAVRGLRLRVVLERARPVEAADRAVAIGPLDDAAFRILVAELLGVDPAPRLLQAARAVSGGLPGRLCRAVAEGYEAGLDPARPATLEELGRGRSGEVGLPEAARALAEHLAVAGGALAAAPARRAVPDAAEQARALLTAGLAHADGRGRIALRDDVRRAVRAQLEPDAARARAEALPEAGLDPVARAHVRAARGDAGAARAFEEAMEAARGEGDPEGAAALGREALARLPEVPGSLRLALADALRARAREREALEALEGVEGPDAAAGRAELLRLCGELERAREEAARAGPRAVAVQARLALARGDAEAALGLAEAPPPGLSDADEARLCEAAAFAALMRGRPDDAARFAARGLDRARRAGRPGLEARALSVEGAVLQARGRVDEAAARQARAFELADAAGERHAAATYLVNAGLGRLERGEVGPAIDALREGARRLTALSRRREAARALYNLGNAASLVGDDALARDALRRGAAWAEEVGDAAAAALAAVVEAEQALRAGKLEAAARTLERAWAREGVPDAVRVTVGARRAIVAAVRGRLGEARAALAAVAERPTDRAGEVERALGRVRLALAEEAFEPAAAAAAEAAALAAEGGWEVRLRAALAGAEAFERAGRAEASTEALARARALLDRAGATLPSGARARLRAVSAYQRAFGAAPRPRGPRERGGAWRILARRAKALVREPRLARLHEGIVDAAVELADAERGFLVTRSRDGALKVRAARAFGADLADERPSASVAARVLDAGRPLVTVDALEDDRLDRAASVHAMALRSVLAVPIPLGGARAAALVLDDRLRPGAFDEATVAVVSDLAELAAGAIERAEALRRERRERRRLARDKRRLSARVESAEQELSALRERAGGPAFEGIVAESESLRRALRLAARVASADVPVLVRGESGTGKELVARAIHDASPRADGPYVGENCAAIPETLLESTLFGHVRGAFTGADAARRGLFEVADGGTLFLDEIGEMSEPMQAKLLRVLQDGRLRPIGSERERTVDVRLVAATHRDLERMVAEGTFRQDLFYRIAVVQVGLPPLRERPEDVAPLVEAFLARHAPDRRVRVDEAAMRALRAFAWPGNVRQLENEIRRALVLAEDVVRVEHLSEPVRGEAGGEALDELDLKGQVDALERRLIVQALSRTDGNQTRAAELLGVSRYGLQKMMKRLGVPKPR
jgi:transcriptional regulator with GAF, ATPase, and Fis domain/tetratricopeptide (TPR) repeat protein